MPLPPPPWTLQFSGAGHGVPGRSNPRADKPPEEYRFIRRREAAKQAAAQPPSPPGVQQSKCQVISAGSLETGE